MAIAAAAVLAQAASADFNWSNVSMAGGGFVSAVIASPVDKGLFYARTDVGGAYRWDESTAKWYSMMDWVDVSERGLLGIEAIAVDPQESGVVYMVAGTSYWNSGRSAFLRSTDKGIRFMPEQEQEMNISSREFIKKAEFINVDAMGGEKKESTGGSGSGSNSGHNQGGNSGSNTGGGGDDGEMDQN